MTTLAYLILSFFSYFLIVINYSYIGIILHSFHYHLYNLNLYYK